MCMQVAKAFENFRFRPADAWMRDYPGVVEELQLQAAAFPSWALPSIDKPVVLCGVVHQFGEGAVWMVTAEGFEKQARRVLAQQRALLATMYDILGLHRLQMTVEASRADAARWAQALGFAREHGPLVRKGPRAIDMDLYLFNPEGGKS